MAANKQLVAITCLMDVVSFVCTSHVMYNLLLFVLSVVFMCVFIIICLYYKYRYVYMQLMNMIIIAITWNLTANYDDNIIIQHNHTEK